MQCRQYRLSQKRLRCLAFVILSAVAPTAVYVAFKPRRISRISVFVTGNGFAMAIPWTGERHEARSLIKKQLLPGSLRRLANMDCFGSRLR